MTKTKKRSLPPVPETLPQWQLDLVRPWSQDFAVGRSEKQIVFQATGFEAWVQASGLPLPSETEETRVGGYVYRWQVLPLYVQELRLVVFMPSVQLVRGWLPLHRSATRQVSVGFDAPVRIPQLVDAKTQEVWMSLTPNEIYTQRQQIRRAKKHTFVAGLGMGWAVRQILDKPAVTRVTVVERDPEVIKFFGEPLRQQYGDKLTLQQGDAYEADHMAYDAAVWDIWETVGEAGHDRRFLAIRDQMRAAGKVCEGWTCWKPREQY